LHRREIFSNIELCRFCSNSDVNKFQSSEKTRDFAYVLKKFISYSTVHFNYPTMEIVDERMPLILRFFNGIYFTNKSKDRERNQRGSTENKRYSVERQKSRDKCEENFVKFISSSGKCNLHVTHKMLKAIYPYLLSIYLFLS